MINSSCVPISLIVPLSKIIILLALLAVEIRCVITIVVVLSLFTFQGEVNNENYNFLHNITSRIKYPDIQIIIHKKDDNINTDLDPFVIMARKMNVDGLITNIFIVENTFGTRDNPNLTAFEKIRLIIDNAIKEYIE